MTSTPWFEVPYTFYHLFCPSVPPLFVIKSLPSLEIKPTSTSDYKCRWQSHLDCSAIQQFLTMTLFSIFSFLFKQTLQLIKVKNVHPEYCAGFWTHNLHDLKLVNVQSCIKGCKYFIEQSIQVKTFYTATPTPTPQPGMILHFRGGNSFSVFLRVSP